MDILWRYDELGREISRKSGVQGQGFEYETKTAYNKYGDKISESSGAIKPSKPPKDQRTSTWSSPKDQRTSTWSFDAQRRPTAHHTKRSQGDRWHAEDVVWSWSADGTGLRTNTSTSHDAVARVTARAAVRMRGAEVVVLWEERYAQGSAAIYRTTNTYDAAGRLIRVEQISGDETSSTDYTYDAAGRLVSQRGGLPRRGGQYGVSRQEWRFR
jgi:YD repeat-containing protein